LSKIGFSLDSKKKGRASDDLLVTQQKLQKSPILHAEQASLPFPRPGYWPPRIWTAFNGKGNPKSQSKT
jgi:hypothetical protein